MTATLVETPAPSLEPTPATAPKRRRELAVGMRWKLLTSFGGVFTIVFAFISIWVFQFASETARTRLESQLATSAVGGVQGMDVGQFVKLNATVAPKPDSSNKHGLGYPDSPLYYAVAKELYNLKLIVKDAGVYSYFKDPADGKLYFSASAGAALTPPDGVTFKVPVADIVEPATYAHMESGLSAVTMEPDYTDAFGQWTSAYAPILDANGKSVGAIGLDYPLTYVAEVQSAVKSKVLPVLIGIYIVLLFLVLALATGLTRPLKKLTLATQRIAEGEYDLDVRQIATSRFPDEMYELAESVARMAAKVGAREATLTREVQRLKIEIDYGRREEAVKEITESDAFNELTAKALEFRRRMREDPAAT